MCTMNQVELVEALTAMGFDALFAGTLLVVEVNNRKDVPKVIQKTVKNAKSLPVFIKFRDQSIEPMYYGSALAIAKIIGKFGCGADMVCCWRADKKINYDELEDFLKALHNR